MKLEEVIEILQQELDNPGSVFVPDLNHALELGIEALKWRVRCEKGVSQNRYCLLPGETKD